MCIERISDRRGRVAGAAASMADQETYILCLSVEQLESLSLVDFFIIRNSLFPSAKSKYFNCSHDLFWIKQLGELLVEMGW